MAEARRRDLVKMITAKLCLAAMVGAIALVGEMAK
jgi:hypothetical protein